MTRVPPGRRQVAIVAALLICLLPALAALAAPLPGFGLLSGAAQPGGTAPPGANLVPPDGTTSRVSVSSSELQALGRSEDAQIAGGGRYVAFASLAGNLVAGDSNGSMDVFVRDLRAGSTARLPILKGGAVPAGGIADQPSISADGRFVVFRYQAPTTGTSDGPRLSTLYLWERGKGTIQIGTGNLVRPREPAIAPDGSWVAFTADPPSGLFALPTQVYAWNRARGQLAPVSTSAANVGGNAASSKPSISNGGRFVSFQSAATNLAGTDPNPNGVDIFLKDRTSGTVTNLTPIGPPPSAVTLPSPDSDGAVISTDGAFVTFATEAALLPADLNGTADVYRWSQEAATYELVSADPTGAAAASVSAQPSMSADGRYVAFASLASNLLVALAPGATPPPATGRLADLQGTQVYLRDTQAAETILISVTRDGLPTRTALLPSVSDDGRAVVFQAGDANLVDGDTNESIDIFLRDLPPVFAVAPDAVNFGAYAVGLESLPSAITIGNLGWADLLITGLTFGGANPDDFSILADPCTGVPIPRNGRCTITVGYGPTDAGNRAGTLQIAHNAAGSPRSIRLTGTATNAHLEVSPQVGPTGFVVTALGTGFPAGSLVRLTWYPGVTPTLPLFQTDASGSFTAQILVFHRDVLGPRVLRAEPAGGECFPATEARFLVVQSSGQPGAYSGGYLVRPNPIIRPVGNSAASMSPPPSVAPCTPGSTVPVPSLIPGIATMAPPTAGPIGTAAPTPSPTPSPTPNTGPAISDIEVSDVGIREIGACSPFSVTFSLLASDPTGVKTVRFYWRKPGAGSYTFKSMSLVAGRWTASLDGNGDNISPSGTLNYYFVAYDSLDATTSTGVSSITVYPASDCIL